MKILKNIFQTLIKGAMVVGVLFPMASFANRDVSVDCAGRPRWDRFVVDENSQWDPTTAGCFGDRVLAEEAKRKAESNSAGMYGAPTMYGEYEGGAHPASANSLYGTYDNYDPRKMYGKDDGKPGVKPKPAPVRTATPASQYGQPKHPVVAKPVAPKTAAPKPAPVVIVQAPKQIEEPKPVPVVQPAPAPKPVVAVVPDKNANNIARSLNDTVDIDSYCTQINPPVLGELPKGLILMPGRPDLMSCVQR